MDVETTPLLLSSSQQPLLSNYSNNNNNHHKNNDQKGAKDGQSGVLLVDFSPLDPTNPIHFPRAYKYAIVFLLALMAFVVTFTCIGIVPVASGIVADLTPPDQGPEQSKSASVLLVTIWELGEAAGPLIIAPLSEIYGRWRIVNVANVGFILATAAAAACPAWGGPGLFIALRALTGFTVMSNVLNPAVVGDLFESEERGRAMSFMVLAPLTGGAVGPLIAGAVSERFSWRAVLWCSVTLASACELLFLTCFRETYGPAILRRRAAQLRQQQEEAEEEEEDSSSRRIIKTPFDDDEESSKTSALDKLANSLLRPGVIFFSSPVLMAISLYGAVSFTVFYILSTTLPDIVRENYGLSPSQVGAVFVSFSLGSIVSVAACNLFLDRIYVCLKKRRNADRSSSSHQKDHVHSDGGILEHDDDNDNDEDLPGEPEFRLPLLILGALTLPIMVAVYGWAAQAGQPPSAGQASPVPLPVMEAVLVAMGASMLLAFMPLLSYVVDATGLYAASALTAVIVTRCLTGTFLPLAATPLIARFGAGLGLGLIAAVLLVLAPIPIAIYRYGPRWRQGSVYTRTT